MHFPACYLLSPSSFGDCYWTAKGNGRIVVFCQIWPLYKLGAVHIAFGRPPNNEREGLGERGGGRGASRKFLSLLVAWGTAAGGGFGTLRRGREGYNVASPPNILRYVSTVTPAFRGRVEWVLQVDRCHRSVGCCDMSTL